VRGTHKSKHMEIGIIGAGHVGSTLARTLAKAGHSILIANSRGPNTLKRLADETGAKAVSARDAMQGVNVLILSIPLAKLPLLRESIARLPDDVVVADTSNYFPVRDGQIPAIDAGQVESLWVSEQIGHPVIKAWNNVLAVVLAGKGLPTGAEGRIALSVAGDDPAAKNAVMSLVEDTGLTRLTAALSPSPGDSNPLPGPTARNSRPTRCVPHWRRPTEPVRPNCARRWSRRSWRWATRSRPKTSCACTGRQAPRHEGV
jgi:predicted dinucleotide-binding enzyme